MRASGASSNASRLKPGSMRVASVIPGVRPVAERRRLQRPRETQCQLGTVALADRELASQFCLVVPQSWMPQLDAVVPARHLARPTAGLVGAPVPGSVRHQEVREHLVVDVAAEGDDPGLIEMHRRIRLAAVEGQLKVLGGRERVDLVTDGIAVWELNGRADRND